MAGFATAIDNLSKLAEKANTEPENEYIGSDGFIHCRICGSAKQTKISVPNLGIYDKVVSCVCKCYERATKEALEYQRELDRKEYIETVRQAAFKFDTLRNMRFVKDHYPDFEERKICWAWADKFTKGELKKWLFIQGESKTGKTFYACCIANAVISCGYTAKVTNVMDLDAEYYRCESRTDFFAKYCNYDLLVLDDFTCDIPDDKTVSIVGKIVSDRMLAHRPMVFTSADNDYTIADVISRQKLASKLINKIWSVVYSFECTKKEGNNGI